DCGCDPGRRRRRARPPARSGGVGGERGNSNSRHVTRNQVRVTPLPVRQVLRFAVILAALVPAAAYGANALYISPANSLEPTLLSELNLVRAENGVKPLRLNARLSAAANQHSMEMIEAGYFGH